MAISTGLPSMLCASITNPDLFSEVLTMSDNTSTIIPPAERVRRRKPPTSAHDEEAKACLVPTPRLVAATTDNTQNTLVLGLWVEVLVVNDRGKPLADERCILWNADGSTIEKKTNSEGVVWFDNLPYYFDEDLSQEDITRPAFQLPDILEEWNSTTKSDFPKPDSYRSGDRNVWFVPAFVPKFQVMVNQLSEEDKFQHFRHAYEDNGAIYEHSNPQDFSTAQRRWNWGKGAVCNQHVNFFLGYWFNYNHEFTKRGYYTTTVCLPLYSSKKHKFFDSDGKPFEHRGYAEFVEAVSGEGIDPSADVPESDSCIASYNKAYLAANYLRISRYFDRKTREPNDKGKALIASLANFNFYSVSDITEHAESENAVKDTRQWLEKHKAKTIQETKHVSKHKTVVTTKVVLQDDFRQRVSDISADKEIKHLSHEEIWSIIWILGDDDEELKLLKSLEKHLNKDHHGGILLKRLRGGDPPLPDSKPEDCELWTFSADGAHVPGPVIRMKKFADNDLKTRKFYHLAIWKSKSLSSGGYAPGEPNDNEGHIDTNEPPRFIHWG